MAIPGIHSTVAQTNSRSGSVIISGKIADSGASGPLPLPAGFMVLQSTASLTNQVVSTNATALTRASFMYIPVTTGELVGASAPPFVQVGTPLVWNDARKVLSIWSSGSSSWMSQLSSVGGGYWSTS